jgi:hypothetical protein
MIKREPNVAQQTQKRQGVEAKLYSLTQGESYETFSQTLERDKQALARQLDKATQSYQVAHDKFIRGGLFLSQSTTSQTT